MTVIQGVNGAGKTNMLNAVDWCLYGKEEHLSKYDSKQQPVINDAELRDTKQGQRVCARVVVKMMDEKDNNRFYQFERSTGVRKEMNNRISIDRGTDFHVHMQIGKDVSEIRETEVLLNRILPHGVKHFFFFDGEQLDEFFKEEKSAKVGEAILDVSQLYLLDKAIDHLEKTISSIRNEIKGESPRVEEIQEKIKEIEGGLENTRKTKKEKEDRLKTVKGKVNDIEVKLRDSSESVVKALQGQRENLNKRLEDLEGKIDRVREQAVDNLIETGPSIYCLRAVNATICQIEKKTEKGDIPPKIRQTFVRELLEKGECICGTNIKTNIQGKQRLEELLKRVKISEIYDEINTLKYELNPIKERTNNFFEQQSNLRKSMLSIAQERDGVKQELQEVSTKLQGINVEEIMNLEITRKKLKEEEETLVRETSILEQTIDNARRTIDTLNKELDQELAKSKKHAEVNEKLRLGNTALNSLGAIRQKLVDDIRNSIQEKTKDYFLRLIWKKETYRDVVIDRNYSISVLNRLGSECLGTLSAGERQILALSFLAALREASGFDAPIIIDTPLGRISKEHKENIAELLPQFLKDAQVTMFMTDEEYTPKVRELILRNVGKEYELSYDERSSQTKVRVYGD
jgi:DNA sulfur modification protein DndD